MVQLKTSGGALMFHKGGRYWLRPNSERTAWVALTHTVYRGRFVPVRYRAKTALRALRGAARFVAGRS